MENQKAVNIENSIFWNELCGSVFAKSIGINDYSADSLAKYDKWYFDFYPYLRKYLDILPEGKDVLEIGLGYGTVSTYLAKKSNRYFGLDIANEPVEVVNARLESLGKEKTAQKGSAHELPFENNTLDVVVSIGCFHHTGNVKRCIEESYRVLRKGGTLLFMCYNKHSFRMLKTSPFSVFFNKSAGIRLNADKSILYDSNESNVGAPFTELNSSSHYKKLCHLFSSIIISKENWDGRFRSIMLNNFSKILGLDLYVICNK